MGRPRWLSADDRQAAPGIPAWVLAAKMRPSRPSALARKAEGDVPQLTACFTSAARRLSSAAVSSVSA